ncbi:hypothetical protein F3Y22_tig00111276pilonHSYRG00105 [Hibiscus syriacus]|uniref:Monocopper oxidase-like protein SKS1 n=1 Tax=Hibiscus syriacus TaxID=106335 RepID=A0A6A2YRJ6_HIBSY|nr:hypothetical protein F3Y22_tig00111276pilonHSYRG00105 [Hibiscus syriacus]
MAVSGNFPWLIFISALIFKLLIPVSNGADIYLEWTVITINGMFPGPLINATANDVVHVNVFNKIDEPLLFSWASDGVVDAGMGYNKDLTNGRMEFPEQTVQFSLALTELMSFSPIRVNNRPVIEVPFAQPENDFDLLIADWYQKRYKEIRSELRNNSAVYEIPPDKILMNGKGSYLDKDSEASEFFTVTKGKTYRFRISNVGTAWSFNFRIQNHRMVLVETEGSYVNQMPVDSLDVHVGQSYSVLVTADQREQDYYIVAVPKQVNAAGFSDLIGVAVLQYDNSIIPPRGGLPLGPNSFDIQLSIDQAKSIISVAEINGKARYTVNNVSYLTPETPLKLSNAFANGGNGVYVLDKFPTNSSIVEATNDVFVASGILNGWTEFVFKNDLDLIHTCHLDGFGFFAVGFGDEQWTPNSRSSYNTYDPVIRSTIQVYPGRWTALYVRVYDPDPNPAKEKKLPENMLLCCLWHSLFSKYLYSTFMYRYGIFGSPPPPPPPSLPPPPAPMAPANCGSSNQTKCIRADVPKTRMTTTTTTTRPETRRDETDDGGGGAREFPLFSITQQGSGKAKP